MPTKTLSKKVIERFLKGDDLKEFYKKYDESKVGTRYVNRASALQIPLSKEDLEQLKFYTQETEKPIKDYCKENNLNISLFYGRVQRIALCMIAQHPQILEEALKK